MGNNSQLLAIDEVLATWRGGHVTDKEAMRLIKSLLGEKKLAAAIVPQLTMSPKDAQRIIEWMDGIISHQTRAAIVEAGVVGKLPQKEVLLNAYVNDQLAGYSFCINKRSATCVRPMYRRRGIGKQLFTKKVELFKERNPGKILHTVIDSNNRPSLEMVGHETGIEVMIVDPTDYTS